MRSVTMRRSWPAGALALMLAWILTPAAVPLYDGVSFPDEPYRYVHPPPGYRHTAPPTSAVGRIPAARRASSGALDIFSKEMAPQVEVYIATTALTGAPAARRFDVRADPLAPRYSPPATPINGNLYRVRAGSEPPGPVTINTKNPDRWIALRAATTRDFPPTMLYRPTPTAPWHTLSTQRAGTDIYNAAFTGPGDYALSFLPHTAQTPRTHPTSKRPYSPRFIVIMTLLLSILLSIAAIRTHRTRQPQPPAGP
jgi:hypothetical protein